MPPDSVLFGRSEVMQNLKRKLSRIGTTSVPVVLHGEMCSGKSLLSRFIHARFVAQSEQYLRLNCGALSEWWDYVTLAAALKYSMNVTMKVREVEIASSIGTLFLNQVCDLPPKRQHELSHLLADYDWNKKRDETGHAIRILSSSSKDLRQEVKAGRFRRDLFDRLAVVTIEVPPLRDRLTDIPVIIDYLRGHYAEQSGADYVEFSPDLLARMMSYSWPGNFCELESFVRRHIALKGDYSPHLHQVPRASADNVWTWDGVTDPTSTANRTKRKM